MAEVSPASPAPTEPAAALQRLEDELAALAVVGDGIDALQTENLRMRLALLQIKEATTNETSAVALKCHSWALTGLDEQVEWKVPS